MPNWVFSVLTVTAPTRKPRKGRDDGLALDKYGRVSDLRDFTLSVETPDGYERRNGDAERIPFDFEAIIPTPLELYNLEKSFFSDKAKQLEQKAAERAMIKKHGQATAYDFHVEKWGTKWNACDCTIDGPWQVDPEKFTIAGAEVQVTKRTHTITYRFNTAWSPAWPVILEVSRKWPKFSFVYDCEEEAWMFDGFEARVKAGEVTRQTVRPYQPDEEEGDE